MKLANKLLSLFEDSADKIWNVLNELGLTDIIQIDFSEIDEEGNLIVSFVNIETDEDMTIAFGVDEDGKPIVLYVDSEDDDGESEYIELDDMGVGILDGKIDFSTMDWLTPELLLDILDGEDQDEAFTYVVRGGKKVRKKLVRQKRRKPMTAKRRQAIRKAVLARRKSKAQAQRKRARSLKLRNRSKLKRETNPRMRVAY